MTIPVSSPRITPIKPGLIKTGRFVNPITRIPTQQTSTFLPDKTPDVTHLINILTYISKSKTTEDINQTPESIIEDISRIYKLQLDDVGEFTTMTDLEVIVFLVVYFDTQGQYVDSNYHISLSKKVSLSLVRGLSYEDVEVNKIKVKYFR